LKCSAEVNWRLKAEAAVEKCRFRMIISHTAATISSHVLTHPVTLKEKKKEKKKAREIEGEKERADTICRAE